MSSLLLVDNKTKPETVYLSLGSNVGDREENLRAAIAALDGAGVRVERVSSIYETEPVDLLEQPWFLNCVVQGETSVPAVELLGRLREIDLDILLYGQQTIDSPELQVPHPRMHLRRFVLAPLAEIAPEVQHPSWSGTAAGLLVASEDRSTVKKLSGDLRATK